MLRLRLPFLQILPALAALFLLGSVPGLAAPRITLTTAPKTVRLDDGDNGDKVTVRSGGTVVLSLDSNPTTGYSWQITNNDTQLLKPNGKPQYKGPKQSLPGAGGQQVFRFTTAGTGKTTLQLKYSRPFEKKTPPVKTYSVEIRIRE